jgi:arylsulfatase A-like enzyme
VILISLDTVSAEHLSLYGYHRDTTPELEALAGSAVVFDHAYVQLPGTLPSHMSMMTGLYPDQHGVFPPSGVLDPAIGTLAEAFRAGGFRTAGFTEGGFVSGRFGFSRGFEIYTEDRVLVWTGGNHVFEKGLEHLARVGPEERFFMFLHTYAAHDPYTPPKECRSLYWEGPPPEDVPLSASRVLTDHNNGWQLVTRLQAEYYASQYDAEIRCLDAVVGDFVRQVGELGLLDDTTLVITSDHGEEFLQHGMMAHEQVYNENLHVPLLVRPPGGTEGRRVSEIVESIDIAPTLLELAGLEPMPGIPGRSLVPLLGGRATDWGEEAFSRSIYGDRSLIAFEPRQLYHLVDRLANPHGGPQDPLLVARQTWFWAPPGRLELQARSYGEPSVLEAEIDGTVVASVRLDPGRWLPVTLDVPDNGTTHLVWLSSETCSPTPKAVEEGGNQCASFLLTGMPDPQTQLFRTSSDRAEAADVSLRDPEVRDAMVERLGRHRYEAVAGRHDRTLEPELEEQLRALVYLDRPAGPGGGEP